MLLASANGAGQDSYNNEINQWRVEREQKLQAPDNWLAVAGLFWLKEGENRFGSGKLNAIVLPIGPAYAGSFIRQGRRVTLQPAAANVRLNGKAASAQLLQDDGNGSATPDIVQVDRLSLFVVPRGNRMGIRLRDPESSYRKQFAGLRWAPVKSAWRKTARFTAYPKPHTLAIPTIIGEKDEMIAPGYVTFQHEGKPYQLEPVYAENNTRLFFIFRDTTSRTTTYQAGRYLYSDLPENGQVTLDFNKAYNPPCVFTPFATCPLPLARNRLNIPIPVGELRYSKTIH